MTMIIRSSKFIFLPNSFFHFCRQIHQCATINFKTRTKTKTMIIRSSKLTWWSHVGRKGENPDENSWTNWKRFICSQNCVFTIGKMISQILSRISFVWDKELCRQAAALCAASCSCCSLLIIGSICRLSQLRLSRACSSQSNARSQLRRLPQRG